MFEDGVKAQAPTIPSPNSTQTGISLAETPLWQSPQATSSPQAIVNIPGSKSLTARAMVLALLASYPTTLIEPLSCRDTELMKKALLALGAKIELKESDAKQSLHITPPAKLSTCTIDCGLSGTVMRFLPAVAALGTTEIHFIGDKAAQKRPMQPLLDALESLGAQVTYHQQKGFLPFSIKGIGVWENRPDYLGYKPSESCSEGDLSSEHTPVNPSLKPINIQVDSSLSSQFLSALLLIAPRIPQGITISLANTAPSATHIAMTLGDLARQGVSFSGPDATQLLAMGVPKAAKWSFTGGFTETNNESHSGETSADFPHTSPAFSPRTVQIEPDLTNAGIFLAGLALHGGELIIPNWPSYTEQPGDYWREIMRAFTGIAPELITISNASPLVSNDSPLMTAGSHLETAAHPPLAYSTLRGDFSTVDNSVSAFLSAYIDSFSARFSSSETPSSHSFLYYRLPPEPVLKAVDLDLQAYGELAPTVAALASVCEGPSYLRNIGHLRGHETDRLTALKQELEKIGAQVEICHNDLVITGSPARLPAVPTTDNCKITSGLPIAKEIIFHTYHDHRMAMSGALLSSLLPEVKIENMKTVRKTFPTFPQLWESFIITGILGRTEHES